MLIVGGYLGITWYQLKITRQIEELETDIIALDRQERGLDTRSAIQEVEAEHNIPVISIVCLNDLLRYLQNNAELAEYLPAVEAYRQQYGIE